MSEQSCCDYEETQTTSEEKPSDCSFELLEKAYDYSMELLEEAYKDYLAKYE